MTFKPATWYPIAVVLSVLNLVGVGFAPAGPAGPAEPWIFGTAPPRCLSGTTGHHRTLSVTVLALRPPPLADVVPRGRRLCPVVRGTTGGHKHPRSHEQQGVRRDATMTVPTEPTLARWGTSPRLHNRAGGASPGSGDGGEGSTSLPSPPTPGL